MKKKLSILLVLVTSIFLFTNNVKATAKAYVGGVAIEATGTTDSVYGDKVKLEDKGSNNYLLTLNNANITNYVDNGSDAIGIYFNAGNLTIKLVGNNTITSTKTASSSIDDYSAISVYKTGETRSINIIGNGTLNINATGYKNIVGIGSDNITVGDENDTNGPTINGNIVGVSTTTGTVFIHGDYDIYNSNLKIIDSSESPLVLYNPASNSNTVIKNSDVNIKFMASSGGGAIYQYDGESITIENTDMLIKGISVDDSAYSLYALFTDKQNANINIKDSRIVTLNDDSTEKLSVSMATNGSINFNRTSGKEFIYLANNKFNVDSVGYTNINDADNMAYSSETSLEDVTQVSPNNTLKDSHYIVLSTPITNKVTSGNNQTIVKNNTNSYSFKTNHFRYLIKNIKLDDTELNEEDYTLEKNGTVKLTSTGLTKLNNLSLGEHQVKLDYYFGNDVTVKLTLSETSTIKNPQTSDNVVSNILIGIISLMSLISCYLLINKKVFN